MRAAVMLGTEQEHDRSRPLYSLQLPNGLATPVSSRRS
jgi:hypothetical protein